MNLASVSQTEIDMKKIQVKIKQLERNLENFNSSNPTGLQNVEAESELSLSLQGNATDTGRTEEETDVSDFFGSSPRFRYWGGKAGDMISALATRMNEKVSILSHIRETRSEHGQAQDFSASTPDVRPLDRIVSSSAAFQNFLKSLHNENKNHTVVYDTF
ncbi:unnamed protein product [Callosobruchus maculatus]|nr:unnamed protein product [Callosobruchus maculatus]